LVTKSGFLSLSEKNRQKIEKIEEQEMTDHLKEVV
jgi:hypothetical protein